MYEFGKIVLVPFPFTDLSSSKLRPALIISKKNQEGLILAFITTKQNNQSNSGFSLSDDDQNFAQTGLKISSMVRFDKLATINKKLILGEIGSLSTKQLKQMKPVFYSTFGF